VIEPLKLWPLLYTVERTPIGLLTIFDTFKKQLKTHLFSLMSSDLMVSHYLMVLFKLFYFVTLLCAPASHISATFSAIKRPLYVNCTLYALN